MFKGCEKLHNRRLLCQILCRFAVICPHIYKRIKWQIGSIYLGIWDTDYTDRHGLKLVCVTGLFRAGAIWRNLQKFEYIA